MSNQTAEPIITQHVETKRGAHYRIIRIDRNGQTIGRIIGRPERHNSPRLWDYKTGNDIPTSNDFVRLVYGHTSLRSAVEALTEANTHGRTR